MDVDEPGGHDAAGRVDDRRGLGPGELPDGGDAAVADPDVGPRAGASQPVEDRAVTDDEIEGRFFAGKGDPGQAETRGGAGGRLDEIPSLHDSPQGHETFSPTQESHL